MGEPRQAVLPIEVGLQATYATAGRRLLELVARVLTEAGPKRETFAEEMGTSKQQLVDALHGNGKSFNLLWLPVVLRHDRKREVLAYLAALVSCEVRERQPLTAAEKLELLRGELKRGGADLDAIEARAYEAVR